MTVRVPRLPFSVDPLMAEAKRRARQRRALIAGAVLLLAAVAGGLTLALRSPGGPNHSGGGGGPNGASLGTATRPLVTRQMLAAVHRDEGRMLRLFALPPGAQRLAHEPVLFRRRGVEIFGEIPLRSHAFTRFGYWRVRSSVAAVLSFVKAHPPLGAQPIDGYGLNSSPKVPANRNVLIMFRPIHRLVSDRVMRVYIVKQPHGWTAVRAVATNHPWHAYRFPHGIDTRPQAFFVAASRRPVAGHTFTGVTVVGENPKLTPLVGVSCGGVLGHRPLPGTQHVFSAAPPPGQAGALARAEKVTQVEEVTCSWQIPPGSAGERLRVGNGSRFGARVAVVTAGTPRVPGSRIASPEFSWIVQP
jgi:hypothetical protein